MSNSWQSLLLSVVPPGDSIYKGELAQKISACGKSDKISVEISTKRHNIGDETLVSLLMFNFHYVGPGTQIKNWHQNQVFYVLGDIENINQNKESINFI